uniref:FG-GAP repeat domain-containing protein n=1 Tax=Halobacteriovorax sp. TaxID=2020862 RepID=UPI00356496B5
MRKSLVLSSALLFTGCSSLKKIPKLFKEEKTVVKRKVVEVPAGPSLEGSGSYFKDITKEVGLEGEVATHIYAVDFDGDGHTDIVTLPLFYSRPKFFRYIPKTKKYKETTYNPFGKVVRASYLTFFDFDRDGMLDVLAGTLNQKSALAEEPLKVFRAKKIKGKIQYQQMTSSKKREARPTSSISLLDYNLDGYIDLFEANWLDYSKSSPKSSPDRLYMGMKNFDYKEVSYLLEDEARFSKANNAYVNAKPTFSSSTCDLDQNGFPDILTSSSGGHANKMWMNRYDSKHKDRTFKNFADEAGFDHDSFGMLNPRGGGNSLYSLCTDYNNDGVMDILVGEVSHSFDSENRDKSSFLTGSRREFPPKFLRSEYIQDSGRRVWSQSDKRSVFADFNNDGLIDILVENSGYPPYTRLIYFTQRADHGFEDIAKDAKIDILNPSGVVTLDIDRDGRMDFITGQSNVRKADLARRIYVYKNISPREGRKSIRVYLDGVKSNTHGWGAMIT